MILRKAYRYRLKTNLEQQIKLARQAGCVRYVFNQALSLQRDRLAAQERLLSFGLLCQHLTDWKSQTDWLQEVHSQPLQQTLKDLDRALKDGLTQLKGMPRFKKKGLRDSFRYPQGVKVAGNQIYLPKIGWLSFRKSREIEGQIKNVTVSKRGEHWYISIQTEQEVADPTHPSSLAVGIDLGVVRFATLSNGIVYQLLNSFRQLEKRLAREQRSLARKVKGSNNWRKQKRKLARLHIHTADTRRDYLNKASTQISKNHALVVVEDLQVSNMSASAAGSLLTPGKQVKAKSGLNKSILDQGWYEFRRMLQYKQQWRGGQVIVIPPRYTSQRCPKCEHTCVKNRATQAQFHCQKCQYRENADLVAAQNILAVGHTVLACGDIRQVAV